ncbi:MAG TPA: hypothetical protein VNB59_01310, partial [Solirubrobacterales bacterium]|nr:hypothetical protein [Solirubrobacterales bacterium]
MPPSIRPTSFLLAALVSFVLLPAAASATTTHYLRPDGTQSTSKPWGIVGGGTAWDVLNDEVTESETPSAADYIAETQGGRETRVSLATMNIRGVSVTKAQIWYYAATNQPFEVRSSADLTWQVSNSVGWHSLGQTVTSQAAL